MVILNEFKTFELKIDAIDLAAGVPVLAYGNFITVALNFMILAGVIFLMVRQINRLKTVEAPTPATVPKDIGLLREIRDSLRQPR